MKILKVKKIDAFDEGEFDKWCYRKEKEANQWKCVDFYYNKNQRFVSIRIKLNSGKYDSSQMAIMNIPGALEWCDRTVKEGESKFKEAKFDW